MAVYRRGETWWYKFRFANRDIRESAKTSSKTVARAAENQRRRELEEGYNDLLDSREARVQTLSSTAASYLAEYKLRHRSGTFASYAIGHLTRLLGKKMLVDFSDGTVKQYQSSRLKEGAAPKSINEEVGFLLRILGDRGDAIRIKLKRSKALKLRTGASIGKAFTPGQKASLVEAATLLAPTEGEHAQKGTRSPYILPALLLGLNTGMRDAEIRNLTWGQIDLHKRFLIVGRAKTEAGEGRTIPINAPLLSALLAHARWYTERFGTISADWFVFPGRPGRPARGQLRPLDPTKPVTSLKTAWRNVKDRAGIKGRWHDTRHTLITELAEGGAGEQTIMDIAGHVSRRMLSRYSHISMEAKRKALEALPTQSKLQPATVPAEKAEKGTA